jgi:hypothetical protein
MQRSNNVHRLLIRSPRRQWLPVRRKIVAYLTDRTAWSLSASQSVHALFSHIAEPLTIEVPAFRGVSAVRAGPEPPRTP